MATDRGIGFEAEFAGLWRLLGFVFVFSVFTNILMLTGPIFMLQVYDRVLAARSEETLVALLLLVGLLYAIMWLLDVARGRVMARMGAASRPSRWSRFSCGACRDCPI